MERSNIYKGLGSLDELGTSEIVENLSIYTQKLREKFRGLPEMEAIIYDGQAIDLEKLSNIMKYKLRRVSFHPME